MIIPHLMCVASDKDCVIGTLRIEALIRIHGKRKHTIPLPPFTLSLRNNVRVFVWQ